MLDYRAWIAAAVLLLAVAGGYLVYLHRTRAGYAARSLSAAGQPANDSANQPAGASPQKNAANQTRTLHVDGCNKDFLVKVGELVEPRVVPGAPLTEFQTIYGQASKRGKPGISTWDEGAFALAAGSLAGAQQPQIVLVNVNQGHVVETLDGIELGIDSFGVIFRKARDQNIAIHERIAHNDDPGKGSWTLTVSFDSACGRGFRSEYSRTLLSDPETDRLIAPHTTGPDGKPLPAGSALPRSDVFLNKMVSEYTMVLSNGQDDSAAGTPSEHQ
jgi:hypothetical protein